MDFSGQVALVTGGTRGIGFAIARKLLEVGCKVCVTGVTPANGEKAEKELREKYGTDNAIFVQCDISVPEQLEELFKKTIEVYNRLDILVNNAAVVLEAKWEFMLRTNVNALIQATYLAFQYMDKNKGGHGGNVINIASDSSFVIESHLPVYVASKHAVKGFTESVAMTSIDRYGVRVTGVCPGWVKTDMYGVMVDPKLAATTFYGDGQDGVELMKESQKEAPGVEPSEVADVVMYVLKDETINGQFVVATQDGKALYPPATTFPDLEYTPIN